MKNSASKDEFLRKRAERQRKLRKRRLRAFLVLFIIIALCVGTVLSFTVLFPIKSLSASGSKIYSREQILKISGISLEDNLFAVSREKTERRLKANLPYIEGITLKRSLPDSLEIKVKDAVEFACYEVKGRYYKVSTSDWVLAKESEASADIVNIKAEKVKCSVGEKLVFENSETRELLDEIIKGLKNNKISVQHIDLTNNVEITLRVENRFDVNLGTPNYITEKINHLGKMIDEMPEENKGKINLNMWTNDNTRGSFIAENS